MKTFAAAALSLLIVAGSAAQDKPAPKLEYKVFTSSAPGFLANATLIYGEKEAVLIDTMFLISDAAKLAQGIKATGRKLTTVYVTHSHPDHYFGFVEIKKVFPDAKLVTFKPVIMEIEATWKAKVAQWKPAYKDDLTDAPVIPESLSGKDGSWIPIDGVNAVQPLGMTQGDSRNSSYAWVPALKLVACGDIVYDGVYPWTAETSPSDRKEWQLTLDTISVLKPEIVVPGHQAAGAKNDATSFTFMREYLQLFDREAAKAQSAEGLKQSILKVYPKLELPIVLQIAVDAVFKK